MPGSKTPYFEFCRKRYTPLHLQPWWLDAVCGPENWDAAVSGDPPVAVMPFFITRRPGISLVRQPPFTAYSGPWLHNPAGDQAPQHQQLAFQHRHLSKLIGGLPHTAFFQQTFRPELRNWLPFYWTGFQQTTRYTYLLPPVPDVQQHYDRLKNTLRTELRRAADSIDIRVADDPQLLFALFRMSLARKGLRLPYPEEPFRRLYRALAERQHLAAWVAYRRSDEHPCAGLCLAFDSRQAGVLLTGLDPYGRQTGALHSLYWEAVRFCTAQQITLDFEGSMDPGIERVFRHFGGVPTPFFQVWRAGNRWWDLLYQLKSMVRPGPYRTIR